MSPDAVRRRRRLAFLVYGVFTAAYLVFRAGWTFNTAAPGYSFGFFLLEAYAALCSVAFYATILERRPKTPRPAPTDAQVDVFICTYNESPHLLRRTVRRALALRYPHKTWLLDDGNRPHIRRLAEELGCGYLARGENKDFKAGNLNHALSKTQGELILVLDADHLVKRELLDRLLGYFEDPQVALVQTPQVFYNVDSFQHHFVPTARHARRLWHEGAIFHHAMQPGADRWNAAFFVGTGAVLRRSALMRIGGFALGSITEDAFTCMRLHAAGFKSVYHDEPLAYLLAPESLFQYLTQRLRWGQGSMQILRLENPLWRPGLTWRQRLVYFMALSSFAQALTHLAYYLAPPIFLLGGPAPLHATGWPQLVPVLLHVAVDLTAFRYFLGPLARPLLAECYKFINVFPYLKSLLGLFLHRRLKFEVTQKGRDQQVSFQLLAPQLALLAVNGAGFAAGIIRIAFSPLQDVGTLGIAVATAFSGFFVVVGAMATLFALERIASQREHSFPDDILATARLATQPGAPTPAHVVRLREDELHLAWPEAQGPRPGERLELELQLNDGRGPLRIFGRVDSLTRARERTPGADADSAVWVVQVALFDLTAADRGRLFDRLAEVAIPRLIDPLLAAQQLSGAARGELGVPLNDRERVSGVYFALESKVL